LEDSSSGSTPSDIGKESKMIRPTRIVAGLAALVLLGTPGISYAADQPGASSDQKSSLAGSLGSSHHGYDGIRFGTAVDMGALAAEPEYGDNIRARFTSVTAENVMKWEVVEPTQGHYDWSQADALVDFAQQNGQAVRGHTLVWHSQLPTWLTEGTFTRSQLRGILKKHVTDQVTHFKGKIYEWDVVNEAFNEDGTLRDTLWLQKLGPRYIADAFRWAHAADPGARLIYNDYNIEGSNPKSNGVYDLIKELVACGVPVQGVGLQAHLGIQYDYPTGYRENLQRLADIGMKIAITEADVRMVLPVTPEKVVKQTEYFSGLAQGCRDVKVCTSFTFWGFTDAHSWISGFFPGEGSATPLDENYQEKPAWGAIESILGG
jgi:endo-1,4-beta-xylanase